MKRSHIMLIALAVILIGGSLAQAGLWYPRYWGLDRSTTWVYSTAWVTVPTGYWWGGYNYFYGGYNWGSYSGWYSPYSGYYSGRSWWGWGAPSWYYGFTDWYTYRTTIAWPRTVYWWSRYWDPADTGYTGDFVTEVDGNGQAQAFDPSVMSAIEIGDHHWSYNGGEQEGLFSPGVWVVANPAAFDAVLQGQGFDATTRGEILNEEIFLDLVASNAGGTGDKVFYWQFASYVIPEPATLALLTIGGLAVIRRRRRG